MRSQIAISSKNRGGRRYIPFSFTESGKNRVFFLVFQIILDNTSFLMYCYGMGNKWHVTYYKKQDGTKPVEEYIKMLTTNERSKTLAIINQLKLEGPYLPRPYADLLEDGIHELRIKLTGTQVRILYFFCYQDIVILTNVFDKYTDKVPKKEIKIAKESRNDLLNRLSEEEIRRLK